LCLCGEESARERKPCSNHQSIDIAFHIAADEGWGIPASNAEAFEILARQELFSHEVAIALGATVRLRNRIVHGYASVDLERLWQELPAGLALLETFTLAIAAWLDPPLPSK